MYTCSQCNDRGLVFAYSKTDFFRNYELVFRCNCTGGQSQRVSLPMWSSLETARYELPGEVPRGVYGRMGKCFVEGIHEGPEWDSLVASFGIDELRKKFSTWKEFSKREWK